MDTTLITFMFQASPRTQSVNLIGSWDNFTKRYPMERDIRRSREQWRGCHTFDDIICDGNGNSPKRTGGLKMASTYYYYYELDDGIEVHDTAIPFTTTCPYMPGQPVNILWVPIEISPLRLRSGSVNSISYTEIKTMNPADKFMTPRAPPPKPNIARSASLSSSHGEISEKPCPWSKDGKFGWARLFSGRRSQPESPVRLPATRRSSEPDISISQAETRNSSSSNETTIRQSSSIRSESISRKSECTRVHDSVHDSLMALGTRIPEEISEDIDDDDNFATQFSKFVLEDMSNSITQLSPTPSRHQSSNSPHETFDAEKPLPQLPDDAFKSPLDLPPHLSLTLELPRSHFSVSTISTAMTSPTDSHFGFSDTSSMFDSLDESDLNETEETGDTFTYNPMISEVEKRRFIGYSLPDEEYASELTIRKASGQNPISRTVSHESYPRDAEFVEGMGIKEKVGMEVGMEMGRGRGSALADFLEDLGYLGKSIRDR